MKSYIYNPRTNGNPFEKESVKYINKFCTIILIACLFFSTIIYAVSSTYYSADVIGSSMTPTINENFISASSEESNTDIAFYTTIKSFSKGDVVIVDYESVGQNIDAIKRLIAVGGDTICYYNNAIYVNGEKLNESYLEDDYNYILKNYGQEKADNWKNNGYYQSKDHFESWCKNLLLYGTSTRTSTYFDNFKTKYSNSIEYNTVIGTYILTLPENFVYFLGDNRGGSTDSSLVGPVESKYVLAKVDFVTYKTNNSLENFWLELKNIFA